MGSVAPGAERSPDTPFTSAESSGSHTWPRRVRQPPTHVRSGPSGAARGSRRRPRARHAGSAPARRERRRGAFSPPRAVGARRASGPAVMARPSHSRARGSGPARRRSCSYPPPAAALPVDERGTSPGLMSPGRRLWLTSLAGKSARAPPGWCCLHRSRPDGMI